MNTHNTLPAGVIEGFFGRTWRWQERRELAAFLGDNRLTFYLYAPKADRYLRSQWRSNHPPQEWQELKQTRATYSDHHIDFGVGLSPLDLCSATGEAETQALDRKIRELNKLNLDYLALLFDDMRGDMPQLAERQAQLACRSAELSNARKIILCPTYYSTDPVLEKVFGKAPANYLQDLGRQLDPTIDVFWTGPKVCSEHYPRDHLLEVTDLLGRQPFLWDNYPVNDGAVRSQHLYLAAPEDDRAQITNLISGIAANPMNQFAASFPALAGLGRAVTQKHYAREAATAEIFNDLYPQQLAAQLATDAPNFARVKLSDMSETEKLDLMEIYRSWQNRAPIAKEVCEWLAGGYEFDPNCLTE
ncbi:beta-N-acetylglucosaminidase domain-containing protein [Gilvimarinus algae]|uniref:Beta-N-acetylglucosaminidase domain-containing protein n=1 Tax=Gilvimarinus algae TaxID=3058037 RepID=A0ABT8TF71_9GAMM|nr:beta-N-acetylglucosaminidase domain-containing protein [Gilvimarinus sp. SDUM040014]MDO3382164.1 beta-N-acetylglucosaminidase domain-containing protein [Gilvimarinus sp. SDUM040014]